MKDFQPAADNSGTNVEAAGHDERWLLTQRIVASSQFAKAPQLRDILLYIVGRALEETPPTAIGEYEIACNALGRRPDFDANQDNIVRVQIRHVRKKLEDYFAREGRPEPLVLTIPKGAYIPHFAPREAPPAVDEALALEAIALEPAGQAATPFQSVRPNTLLIGILSLLVLVLSAATVIMWLQREAIRNVAPPPERVWSVDPLWSRIFAAGQQPSIVVADSCRVVMQDILNVDIPLPDYGNGSFPAHLIDSVPDPKLQAALRLISSRQYTSVADLTVAARILELSHNYHSRPLVRYARFFDGRDFKEGNFVLIGSHRGIPWIQLFEPQLNFAFEQDRETGKYQFRNKAPRAGEQTFYRISTEDTYGDIAVVPNLSGTGLVLILSGIDMAATEAMGELVTSPAFSSAMAKMLAEQAGGGAFIEILVEAKAMAGTARAPKIIAHRLLHPPKL
jgi:hypothetical protein